MVARAQVQKRVSKKIQVVWQKLFALLVAFGAFYNLLATVEEVNRNLEAAKFPPGKRIQLKLPTPIFVVGYPKVGTSSIHSFFTCGGIKSSHYCCRGSNRTHTHCQDGPMHDNTCSSCMRENKRSGRPILEGCGDYEVYAQMDAEFNNAIYLPQHQDLEGLHDYAPQSTLILNLRPTNEWVNSVTNWYGLGARFLNKFNIDPSKVKRNEVLGEIYENHTAFVKQFAASHPSHPFIEVDISSPTAGESLSRAFGIPPSCWGQHNRNKKKQNKR